MLICRCCAQHSNLVTKKETKSKTNVKKNTKTDMQDIATNYNTRVTAT